MPLDFALFTVLLTVVVAALVRGFTGFGSALIFMPVASATVGPTVAAPTLLVVDFVLSVPLFATSLRECRWPAVLPTALAAAATAPLGAYALAAGDPVALRWGLSVIIVLLLGLLASGWRYRSEPTAPVSVGVGTLAGLLSGFGQVGGPPVIAFWVSGPYPTKTIRANMFAFFGLISLSSFAAYLWNGFFTADVFQLTLVVAPAYALALYAGSRLFGHTEGTGYRLLAYAVIALAAVTSIPAFDGVLR